MRVHPLRPEDDRGRFDCGDPTLDRFLREFALQNARRHGIGATYVAEESGVVVGYVTLVACSLGSDGLPEAVTAGLPAYPLPALRVARIAVDHRVRRCGIGSALLGTAIDIGLDMSERVGCIGITADVKPGAEGFYERFGFVGVDAERGASAARPRQKPMFLSLAVVRKAGGIPRP